MKRLRWQAACLADDLRRARRRLHDWWNGYGEYAGTGRHCYDTGQIRVISMELERRPWPQIEAQNENRRPPACTDPPCEIEENWTCGYHSSPDWDPAQARLRAVAPRLFAPSERYWGLRLVDFYGWVAWQAAERNRFRDECGLPRIELAPPSARQLTAA